MKNIYNKIHSHFLESLPFVVYKKPNNQAVKGIFQSDKKLVTANSFEETGFVFAPFKNTEKAILIPKAHSKLLEANFIKNSKDDKINKDFVDNEKAKKAHIKQVDKAIKSIENNEFKKVVLSRSEQVKTPNFDLVKTYQKLLENYPNAFVYVWFHPKIGLWLGATPENLLQVKNNQFSTVSLAGTQIFNRNNKVVWKQKERDEQLFVTQFIESQLAAVSTSLKIHETKTVKAGNLLHLKTIISGIIDSEKASLKTIINALHPTPAVCGLPRDVAKKFIIENESYQRTFYTGFLGELNIEPKDESRKTKKFSASLFVNLRCMEIKLNEALIYVGGGITKESNAEKEWQETVAKSLIMKCVLN